MTTIGIVGSEGAKFTPETEKKAREIIRKAIHGYDKVVSGACHLGGIDVWAVEEAQNMGIPTEEFPPKRLSWEGGYKERNLAIASASNKVVCITLKQLPEHYKGMRFELCYHCGTSDHVKSGGCWTVKRAIEMGKQGEIIVINDQISCNRRRGTT